MKKLMTMLVLAALAIPGANAWQIALKTDETNTMIAPPAVDYSKNRQIATRTATNVVAVGALRKSGSDTIICAVAGTTATNISVVTWTTGGVYISAATLEIAVTNGSVVVTNTATVVEPLVVPDTGLTAADGSAYWFKVPTSRTTVVVQPSTLTVDSIVHYEDAAGNKVLENTIYDVFKFDGFNGAIYAHASITGCVVNVFSIP